MTTTDLTLETIVSRLENCINTPVGMRGLNILLHGWIHTTGCVSRDTLRHRKARDGQIWLSPHELRSFSDYVGYDLSQTRNP